MRALTGRIRYRTNWRGKLILQVEESEAFKTIHPADSGYDIKPTGAFFWRDAKTEDVRWHPDAMVRDEYK